MLNTDILIVMDAVLVHKIQLTGDRQLLPYSKPVLILGSSSQHYLIDGLVWAATIHTSNSSTTNRPTTKLYSIELNEAYKKSPLHHKEQSNLAVTPIIKQGTRIINHRILQLTKGEEVGLIAFWLPKECDSGWTVELIFWYSLSLIWCNIT